MKELLTFEEVTEYIRENKYKGFDEIVEKTGREKKQVIALWNNIHRLEWKCFSRTKIDDYIEDTGKRVQGRKIYRFTKTFKFYPSPNETVYANKGFEYDFMSIPPFLQKLVPSDSEWGKLAALIHDYRFNTKTKTVIGAANEFYTHLRKQGAPLWAAVGCWFAVSTAGIPAYNKYNHIEARMNLFNMQREGLIYQKEKEGGTEKKISALANILAIKVDDL